MMAVKQNVTSNCRYLDVKRRVYIPPQILDKAGITTGTMLEFEIQNGCIVAKQVLGITVLDTNKKGALIKKGK
jgi:bifunctional DNA-binding transcriptional regulator/antitoxin component of YhaV-PrlF toxin-antitoxin module